MPSDLINRLVKLANKPGYTPMPKSMLEPPVLDKSNSKAPPKPPSILVSGLADPLPKATLDKINKVYQANPRLKGGMPEVTGASIGFRF